MSLPDRETQIRQSHALLIRQVVQACHNRDALPRLESMLELATRQGWTNLVTAIRAILAGQRDERVLQGLDAEDMVIVRSILEGLQNPASLPDPVQPANPAMAAPGLARMIHAAGRGDAEALQAVAFMAEQMTATQGDLRRLGGRLKRLVDGERDLDTLANGMSHNGRQLLLDLLEELGRLESH